MVTLLPGQRVRLGVEEFDVVAHVPGTRIATVKTPKGVEPAMQTDVMVKQLEVVA